MNEQARRQILALQDEIERECAAAITASPLERIACYDRAAAFAQRQVTLIAAAHLQESVDG